MTTITTELVDESFGRFGPASRPGYRLTRVYRIGSHTVRVEVNRAWGTAEAYAEASVLTAGAGWVELAHDPVRNWAFGLPDRNKPDQVLIAALDPVATALAERARTILGSGATCPS